MPTCWAETTFLPTIPIGKPREARRERDGARTTFGNNVRICFPLWSSDFGLCIIFFDAVGGDAALEDPGGRG